MSDDLISRNKLMEDIKAIHCKNCDSRNGVVCKVCGVDDFKSVVDMQPTAYNPDKVCEEIFDAGFIQYTHDEYLITTNDVVEIVQRGGIDG